MSINKLLKVSKKLQHDFNQKMLLEMSDADDKIKLQEHSDNHIYSMKQNLENCIEFCKFMLENISDDSVAPDWFDDHISKATSQLQDCENYLKSLK